MKRLENVKTMEQILDKSLDAVAGLQKALEQYKAVLPDLKRLEKYYESPQWQQDYEEAPAFQKATKCGVLAEDTVYDLLTARDQLLKELKNL